MFTPSETEPSKPKPSLIQLKVSLQEVEACLLILEETARLNAEEYIKAQAETTRWAARCGVEKGLREQAEARVAELEGLHRTYYNQPFAEACQRAAREERERCIAEAFGWWAGTENLETLTTDEAAEGIRAALQPKSECLIQ